VCGIAGVVRLSGAPVDPLEPLVESMLDALAPRGPDGRNIVSVDGAVLGACRLAIVDPAGPGQPWQSLDGANTVAFNGELYDHVNRRAELRGQGCHLRSTCDTEVVTELLARDGERALSTFEAMFALAWWNARTRSLVLARDRFGEKPLFYAVHDGKLWFASEERALIAAGVPAVFDEDTWAELLLFRYVAGERTPYRGIRRVLPGHVTEVRNGAVTQRRWDTGLAEVEAGPAALRDALDASVRLRLQADVPVGLLVSGGLDSSAVATLAARAAGELLHAFTIAYPGHRMDESLHAREVAQRSGLRHHEIVVGDDELPGLLEDATRIRGAPLTHSATTHLVALSRVAREHVKVLLCGEGADELFGGYDWYQPYRLGFAIDAATIVARAVRNRRSPVLRRIAAHKGAARIVFSGAVDVPVLGLDTARDLAARVDIAEMVSGRQHQMVRRAVAYDQHTHLPSVLEHVDRATMGAGIECRAPFLAPEVAAIAMSAPTRALFDARGKRILRRAMSGVVPPSIVQRRKQGWSAPWQRYLREIPALRELVRSLPTNPVVASAPLPAGHVRHATERFLNGDVGGSTLLWELVRVAVWHDVCIKGTRVLT
jgi:asparagine synthase (glutamine-hydrolysing)